MGLPLTNHKTMSKSLKWEAGLNRFIANCKTVMERLGVDNDVNFLRKVDSLLRELEEANSLKQEWLELTNTSEIGAAKKRTRALMKAKTGEEFASLPSIFMVAPRHWRDGIPATKKTKGEPPMLPSAAERKLRREVWPYLRDLFESLHLVTEIERERIQEDLVDRFLTEPPTVFINSLYNYVHNLDEMEPDEEEEGVPLSGALQYCVGYYPDQLLADCRERAEEAGTVSRSWFSTIDTKFAALTTADDREAIARHILTRFIYRVSGGQGLPLPEVEADISRRLSTERWHLSGPEWIITEETRLDDLLEPLTIYRK